MTVPTVGFEPTVIRGTDLARDWFRDLEREAHCRDDAYEQRMRRAIIAAAACLETHWFLWAQRRVIAFASTAGEARPERALAKVFRFDRPMPSLYGKFVREKVHETLYDDLRFKPMSAGNGRAKRLKRLSVYRNVLIHGKAGRLRVSAPAAVDAFVPELATSDLRDVEFDWLLSVVRECVEYLCRDGASTVPHWLD